MEVILTPKIYLLELLIWCYGSYRGGMQYQKRHERETGRLPISFGFSHFQPLPLKMVLQVLISNQTSISLVLHFSFLGHTKWPRKVLTHLLPFFRLHFRGEPIIFLFSLLQWESQSQGFQDASFERSGKNFYSSLLGSIFWLTGGDYAFPHQAVIFVYLMFPFEMRL